MSDGRKTERLVNLTITLLCSNGPVSFEYIRSVMRDYYDEESSSARIKFERDKKDLKEMGISIALSCEGGSEYLYKINVSDFFMPDMRFNPEEIRSLVRLLQRGLTTPNLPEISIRKTLVKIMSLADIEMEKENAKTLIDLIPEKDFFSIAKGIVEGIALSMPVSFRYRNAAGEEMDRVVEVYGLTSHSGLWYVVGKCRNRNAMRIFRMDRIDSNSGVGLLNEENRYEVPENCMPGEVVKSFFWEYPNDGDRDPINVKLAVSQKSPPEMLDKLGIDLSESNERSYVKKKVYNYERFLDWAVSVKQYVSIEEPLGVFQDFEKRIEKAVNNLNRLREAQ